ncbi:MAG: DUF559 domain-containing protein [Geodermatophilaceae bacterium]|nr:DUF559 domain-containing protein [Geodermatophilaceae bacterium]
MAHDLEILLAGSGASRITDLTTWVSQRSVRTWLGQGRLVRLHPGVIALGRRRDDWLVRAHAAVLYTNGVLSHSTALALWGVIAQGPTRPHVSVPPGRGLRSGPGPVVHRRTTDERPFDIAGLPVTSIDAALVDTWSLLNRRVAHPGSIQIARAAVITAVRSGRTAAGRLTELVSTRANLAGRSELRESLDLIAGGCHSELEIWGVRRVLIIDGLPRPLQQYRVELQSGPVHLDAALPDVQLGIELDGAAFHGNRGARERDIARDAALAAAGWLILRFSYRRLTSDPLGCRRDIQQAYHRRLNRG